MRIATILVGTDFSENAQRAFECAYDIAQQVGAHLHILHVQDEGTLRTAIKEGLLRDDSTDEELQTAVAQLLESRFSQLLAGCDSEVKLTQAVRRGEPQTVLCEYAQAINADLVVVGRRGAGLRNLVLGSVADSVVRNSPAPVLVVRRDQPAHQT